MIESLLKNPNCKAISPVYLPTRLHLDSELHMFKIESVEDSLFSFLPEDWRSELFPQWKHLMQTSPVYVLGTKDSIHCMGIIFEHEPPRLSRYEQDHASQFCDYVYLGYLYTVPEYRQQSRARYWVETIKELYKSRGIWLAIEDLSLQIFYEKLGFIATEASFEDERIYYLPPYSL